MFKSTCIIFFRTLSVFDLWAKWQLIRHEICTLPFSLNLRSRKYNYIKLTWTWNVFFNFSYVIWFMASFSEMLLLDQNWTMLLRRASGPMVLYYEKGWSARLHLIFFSDFMENMEVKEMGMWALIIMNTSIHIRMKHKVQ